MSTEMTETISDRLKRAREKAGLSLAQAVKVLNDGEPLDPQWDEDLLDRIEARRPRLEVDDLIYLAFIYKVSPSWLLDGFQDSSKDKILLNKQWR